MDAADRSPWKDLAAWGANTPLSDATLVPVPASNAYATPKGRIFPLSTVTHDGSPLSSYGTWASMGCGGKNLQ